ncbi:hypothetical protein [Arcticibacter sp.]|uniref:hypothetical protein n=1 Tax=Arcticibacter sp. TaxID=1872630 RepID=UPI0038905887
MTTFEMNAKLSSARRLSSFLVIHNLTTPQNSSQKFGSFTSKKAIYYSERPEVANA